MCRSTLIEDVELVRQTCDIASVAFDDQAVADYFDRQVDAGRKVCQVGRIWVHSHPGSCPQPSGKDEETFARVFGKTDWAVMFILARDGHYVAKAVMWRPAGISDEHGETTGLDVT
jgi:proteasome lid subunit RPN8/RPN11